MTNFHEEFTAQICERAVMEEPVRRRHYNSVLQGDSNVHKANAQECLS